MHDFLKTFDGTGRPPRDVQVKALQWSALELQHRNIIAIQAPPGSGKQAIGTSIVKSLGGVYLAPTNVLVNQAVDTYTDANFLKGKAHYVCEDQPDFTCDKRMQVGMSPCKGCKYREARHRTLKGEPTFSNPIAWFYLTMHSKFKAPEVLVVDEAHKLIDMVSLLCGASLRQGRYGFPNISSTPDVTEWLGEQHRKLNGLVEAAKKRGDTDGVLSAISERERIGETLIGLRARPENYVIYITETLFRNRPDKYLNIVPVEPPKEILDRMLQCKKLVLMSATLPHSDVKVLARGSPYSYLDLPSPIPKENRPILFRPHSAPMNAKTPDAEVAAWIRAQLDAFPGRNTIVHLTYARSKQLAPYFPGALANTPETKDAVLATFKKRGGLWLASGCAEGIDLPGDECRLNLIPMLTRQNPTDPVVMKRLAMTNGRLLYDMDILKTVIQQIGRSTRDPKDESVSVVGDPAFPGLVLKRRSEIPQSFFESIRWHK